MLRLKAGQCPALTVAIYNKLVSANVCTIVQLLSYDVDQLSAKTEVSLRDLTSIRRYILAQHSCLPIDALQMYNNIVTSVCILSTGCDGFDGLLDGGLYTGELTEIAGNRGKTQICMNVAATVATDMSKDVIYYDMGGNFDAFRFSKMAEQRIKKMNDREAVLKRLRRIEVFDIFALFSELEHLKNTLISQTESIALKLIIVDCMSALFLPFMDGLHRDSYCGYITQVMRMLKLLAVDFCIAVLITNIEVEANRHGTFSQLCTPMTNTSVHVHIDNPDCRVTESSDVPSVDEVMTVRLVRSNRLATGGSVLIMINDSGLQSMQT